jgi:ABC-type spermidine/putrescine transport system permease subunit II
MTSAHQHKLPIWPMLGTSYREWRRMLPVLRPLVINAFLIVLAISVLDEFIPARLTRSCSARR